MELYLFANIYIYISVVELYLFANIYIYISVVELYLFARIYLYSPTSVRNVASYSRIRRVSKSIKPLSTSGNKTYQPPLDSGLATLTSDMRPVNQGCSIPPSAAQIMAINTSSNNL